jgi:hypothetical protein
MAISASPDVNVGPDTAFGGKARERACSIRLRRRKF